MKLIITQHLAPGVDAATNCWELFQKFGGTPGITALYFGVDGKTGVAIVETDELDMVTAMTYGPFWDQVTVLPVVDVDESFATACNTALERIAEATSPLA